MIMALRTAAIQMIWPGDEGSFYRKLVDTVAANPGFAGVGSAALFQPAHGPALSYYRQARSNNPGQSVKLIVTASHWPNQMPSVTDLRVENASPPASAQPPLGPPPPAQLSAPAAKWAEVVIGFLEPSSKHGTSKALVDFVSRPGQLELRRYSALNEGKVGPRPAPVSAKKAATELLSLLSAAQSDSDTIAYAAQFEIVGTEWSLRRLEVIATVKPLPEGAGSEDDDGDEFQMTDEGAAVIADIKAFRQLWLSTAAELIAEQDPSRLDNLLMSIAPFALMKIGKIGKIAKLTKLSKATILTKIKVPRGVQLVRGKYHVPATMNPKLVERALDLRKTKFGVEFQHFKKTNVSVWEVKVNGKTEFFDAGNVPISELNKTHGKGAADVGLHSEGFIAEHLRQLEAKGHKVSVTQIYTERPPCPRCAELLSKYSESPVFHSLVDGQGSKAERLMQAYGITH